MRTCTQKQLIPRGWLTSERQKKLEKYSSWKLYETLLSRAEAFLTSVKIKRLSISIILFVFFSRLMCWISKRWLEDLFICLEYSRTKSKKTVRRKSHLIQINSVNEQWAAVSYEQQKGTETLEKPPLNPARVLFVAMKRCLIEREPLI